MSLQLWLPLNGKVENQGLLGNLKHGFDSSPTVSANGKIGKCYTLDGADDCIYIPMDRSFWSGKELSFAIWVKCTKTCTVMEIGADLCMSAYYHETNGVRFGYWRCYSNNGTRTGDTNTDSHYYDATQWHHVVITFDHAINKIYVDGALSATFDSSSKYTTNWVPLLTSTAYNRVNVGRSQGSSSWLAGSVNDVRIYDHCLTPKEVKELSKALVIHYKLDNSGFGKKNLIQESMFKSDPWKSAIEGRVDLDGRSAMLVRNSTLYSKTSSGTTELFPGMVYEANTQYTVSVDWRDDYRTDNKVSSLYIRFEYSDGTLTNMVSGDYRGKHYWTHSKMTSTAGKTVVRMRTTYGNGGCLYIANLKLEKGAEDTGWAPPDDIPIYDCSGYRNDGEIKGTLSPDLNRPRYTHSTYFDGGNNAIIVPYNTACPNNIYTINIWFYKPGLGTDGYETLFGGPSGFEMDTRAGSSQSLSLYMASTRGGNIVSSLPFNKWTMITYIRDGTNEAAYVNGEYIKSITAKSMPNGTYFIGAWSSYSSQNFYGMMSDFRLYNTVLSASDILELYNTTASADRSTNLFVREAVEE